MTGSPTQTRKPYETTPYAALRAGDTATSAATVNTMNQNAAVDPAVPNAFAHEAERLAHLREALWAAFEAGPAAGIPTTLIELTIAYTNALRLELNLMGLGQPRKPQGSGPRISASAPRTKS